MESVDYFPPTIFAKGKGDVGYGVFMKKDSNKHLRILAVDDDKAMLDLYGDALSLLGKGSRSEYDFEVIKCQQGDGALETVSEAIEKGNPFAVVFLDLCLPPGPDGVWTGEQIRKIDPNINFVIVTGMLDVDYREIGSRIPPADKILYVQKPIHIQELRQFATALGAKWQSELLRLKTNSELEKKVKELEKNQKELLDIKSELENVNNQLLETNDALSILARNLDRTRIESEKWSLQRTLLLPIIERFQQIKGLERYKADLDLLVSHIENLTSNFTDDIKLFTSLSKSELRIVSMIRSGMLSREIANHLYISLDTVKSHRKNIRKKLNLRNPSINLKTYLEEPDSSILVKSRYKS